MFRFEYPLYDYLSKIGNFSLDYLFSVHSAEGYVDVMNVDTTAIAKYKPARTANWIVTSNKRTYDVVFTVNQGFLNDPDPLLPNSELRLSFERAPSSLSFMKESGESPTNDIEAVIELEDCYAMVEYISSPALRNYFSTIHDKPISYIYDDCEVLMKNLTVGETFIRVDSIRGGNCPLFFFAAIIPTAHLNGDFTLSSTKFASHEVEEVSIKLNGNTIENYPMTIRNTIPVLPHMQFYKVTNRYLNNMAGRGLKILDYRYNCLYAADFQGQDCSSGWIEMTFKLKQAYTDPMTLVTWSIVKSKLTIDKYHQIERSLL